MDSDTPSKEELKRLRDEVYAHPTDLRRRFDLGAALFRAGMHAEAIQELQKAQGNPHTRLNAMRLLADIFEARKMFDLAASMRERVRKESGEDGDSGSAPVREPKRPITPSDAFGAERDPRDEESAAYEPDGANRRRRFGFRELVGEPRVAVSRRR